MRGHRAESRRALWAPLHASHAASNLPPTATLGPGVPVLRVGSEHRAGDGGAEDCPRILAQLHVCFRHVNNRHVFDEQEHAPCLH